MPENKANKPKGKGKKIMEFKDGLLQGSLWINKNINNKLYFTIRVNRGIPLPSGAFINSNIVLNMNQGTRLEYELKRFRERSFEIRNKNPEAFVRSIKKKGGMRDV